MKSAGENKALRKKMRKKSIQKNRSAFLRTVRHPLFFCLSAAAGRGKDTCYLGMERRSTKGLSAGKREEKREMKDAWREKKKGGNHSEFVPILQFLGRAHKGRECGEMLNHTPPSASKPPPLF